MTLLYLTRDEIIDDLPISVREQNDPKRMTDQDLIAMWERHGIHAGTWDWDNVEIWRIRNDSKQHTGNTD